MISHASNSKSAQSFMFSEDGKYMLKTAVSVFGGDNVGVVICYRQM